MNQKVDYCFNCQKVTNQKIDEKGICICKECKITLSSSTTILGNFINEQLKQKLMEKVIKK